LPTSNAEANSSATLAPVFSGFHFQGPQTSNSLALDMAATYGLTMRDCLFEGYDIGVSIAYGLKSYIENCFFGNCSTHGLRVISADGLWADATPGSTRSNHTHINSCRFYGKTGQTAQVYVRETNNIKIEQSIFEGDNPVVNLDYLQTVAHTLIIETPHLENTPTSASLKIVLAGGRAYMRNAHVSPNMTNGIIIDGTGSSNTSAMVVDGLVSLGGGGNQFKHGTDETYAWEFNGIGFHLCFQKRPLLYNYQTVLYKLLYLYLSLLNFCWLSAYSKLNCLASSLNFSTERL